MVVGFEFDRFELDLSAYELRRSGARIALEKIPMEALIVLLTRAGALVSRSDLKQALWEPDVFVDYDAAINTAVRKVRIALGDDADEPRFVETVVGKGYRFTGSVRAHGSTTPDRGRAVPSPRCVLMRGRREIALPPGEHLIGRDPDARAYVDHPSVSRRHARLSVGAERVLLEDLDSRNGTFVNGQRIEQPMEIRSGATIGVGPVTYRFVVHDAPASTQSAGRFTGARARGDPRRPAP